MHLFILHVLRHHNDMSTKKCQSFTDANNLIINLADDLHFWEAYPRVIDFR